MPDRILPHNLDAEKSVIGAALLSPEALSQVIEVVRPDDFYSKANHDIFAAITDKYNRNESCDIITVTNEMRKLKTLESAGGSAYISELASDVPSTVNAAEYAKIVAEKSMLRKLIQTSNEIKEACFSGEDNADDAVDSAEEKILDIGKSRLNNDYTSIRQVMYDDIEILSERSKSKGGMTGVPTGFRGVDEMTGGLQKSDLIILAARPSMGKTAFALNVALNAAKENDTKSLIISLEMSKEQLGQRLLAMKANIDMSDLSSGNVDTEQWKDIIVASDEIGSMNINIDEPTNPSIYDIKNKCRRMAANEGLDLLIVDYLQLMISGKETDSVVHEVSQLTRMFKLMAKELNIPIILLSQLSRRPDTREKHKPMLSDLRESGSIEQDADLVFFLYRDEVYNPNTEEPGVCEVIIAKHRNGPIGSRKLTWVSRYTKFADMTEREE